MASTPDGRAGATVPAGPVPDVVVGPASALLERISDSFIALDREWRITYMNRAAMAMGRPRGPEVLGRSHWEVWPETLGTDVERQYRAAMETQRPAHFEHHYVLPGLDFWHSVHAYPDRTGLSIFFRDITERKRTDELARLLATASARLVSTLDQSAIMRVVSSMALPLLGAWACVYLVDDAARVFAVDFAAVDERQRNLLRQVVRQLPVTASEPRLPWTRAMRTQEPVLLTVLDDDFYDALGTAELRDFVAALAPRSMVSVPLIARGRVIGGITFGTCATGRSHDDQDLLAAREVALPAGLALDTARVYEEQRRAKQDADAARQRAEEANLSKVDFLRAMSHELRTPLNAIGGYVQLMQMGVHGELNDRLRRDIERIDRNQQHVSRLINDVLSFARLETGRLEYAPRRVPLASILGSIDDFVAPLIGERTHHLEVRGCADDVHVVADPDKATQVLVNLISNALKHTPAGSRIEVFHDAAPAARGGLVRVCVRDNGPGIAAEAQASIFLPFVQLGKSLSRPVEGLGLGLAIARDLARGMNGTLTVESVAGAGTTFALALPRG